VLASSGVRIEKIVRPIPELADAFAGLLEDAYREARMEGRPVSVAVPGGSVAESFFPRLVKLPLDWRRVLVFFGDERGVRPDSDESNVASARAFWLDRVPIPMANVHRMRGDDSDLDQAARDYERLLVQTLSSPPRIDLVLLGLGPDGHVCSLFPGHAALLEAERYVVPVLDSPKPPSKRITLTLLALAAARAVVLAAFGAAKASVVRETVEDPSSGLPAARALRVGPRAVALLDPEAASKLTGS
jgi:6-phosphogluconolactonase